MSAVKMRKKEIRKIKLTLTTLCNLACSYCFVKKTSQRMDFLVAKNAVNILLNSPGKEKLLSMYGGEPLLERELIKKIVIYARKMAKEKRKNLTISLCSNLTLLKDEDIDFIAKNDVKVTVSIVGTQQAHDKFRMSHQGKGSHALVAKNLKRLSDLVSLRNIGISFCLIPSESEKIYEYFKEILELGFYNINFEIIQDFQPWTKKARKDFQEHFSQILLDIVISIKSPRPLFLNTINWEVVAGKLTEQQETHCQAKYNVEVYPSGDMAFSPFLLNDVNKNSYIIGSTKKGFLKSYSDCLFDPKSHRCRNCEKNYYDDYPRAEGEHEMMTLYTRMSMEAAKIIEKKALKDSLYAKYVVEAKNYLGF